jgi:tetratricopeptide (TPR) repeat protein
MKIFLVSSVYLLVVALFVMPVAAADNEYPINNVTAEIQSMISNKQHHQIINELTDRLKYKEDAEIYYQRAKEKIKLFNKITTFAKSQTGYEKLSENEVRQLKELEILVNKLKSDAISDLNMSIKFNPKSPKYLLERAGINDNIDNNIEDLSNAIKLSPKDKTIYIRRAEQLLDKYNTSFNDCIPSSKCSDASKKKLLDFFPAIISDYSTAIKISSKDPEIYFKRADIYNRALFQINLNPNNDVKIVQKYIKAALADLNYIIKQNDNKSEYYSERALTYKYAEKYENAIKDYSKAIDLKKDCYDYASRAEVYSKLNKHNEAIIDYSSAIRMCNENNVHDIWLRYKTESHFKLAESYFKQNNIVQAINVYRSACNDGLPDACVKSEEFIKKIKRGINWELYGNSNYGEHYYDKSKINKLGNNKKRVWVRNEDSANNKQAIRATYGLPTDSYKNFEYSLIHYELNCDRNEIRMISFIDYENTGKILESAENTNGKYEGIVPDSVSEQLYKNICVLKQTAKE